MTILHKVAHIALVLLIASSAVAAQPLGMNLNGIAYYSPEQPFLNIFKTAGPWITQSATKWDTGEEAYLQLDANGYPTTLVASAADPNVPQLFTAVGVLVQRAFPATANGYYPAGQYVVLYDGEGSLSFLFDATVVTASPGRYVINVATPSAAGINLRITATDPNQTGNYLRNIRLVKAEYESALAAGQMFNPALVNLMQGFHAVRFMDWLRTNGNQLSSWADRPQLADAFWSSSKGVPLEAAVAFANAVPADAWLNMPVAATDDYLTQAATLAYQQLGIYQKVYVELSNEVWNGSFPQYQYAVSQGQALWPTQSGGGNGFDWNRNWYGMRAAQACDIWKTVWGADSSRVVCVLGAQAANAWTATRSLNCPFWSGGPCYAHGINAVAIAPYFGGPTPLTWTTQPDGGLDYLFASLYSQNDPSIPPGGFLARSSTWETNYIAALAPYGLPMIAYEGGQSFASGGSGATAQTNLYIAANRDTRMGDAYTTYLDQWNANNGELFVLYNDVYPPSKYGEWGALESIMQGTSPKLQAIDAFVTAPPPPCVFSVSPTSVNDPVGSTTANLAITASDASCYWTAVSGAAWITLSPPTSGRGSASVTYTVAKNPYGPKGPRTGTMTVAGQTVTVTQQ